MQRQIILINLAEYTYTITDGYNNTFIYDIANTAAHGVQHSNSLTEVIKDCPTPF